MPNQLNHKIILNISFKLSYKNKIQFCLNLNRSVKITSLISVKFSRVNNQIDTFKISNELPLLRQKVEKGKFIFRYRRQPELGRKIQRIHLNIFQRGFQLILQTYKTTQGKVVSHIKNLIHMRLPFLISICLLLFQSKEKNWFQSEH